MPDIVVYIEALEKRIVDQRLEGVRIASPFLLRTAEPPIQSVHGKRVTELRRIGKRIVIGLEDDRWRKAAGRPRALAAAQERLAADDRRVGRLGAFRVQSASMNPRVHDTAMKTGALQLNMKRKR